MRLPLPLVTVVVPTCDRPAFVKLALQQIAQQTIENLEVLIVDDTPGRDQSHSYLEGAAVDRLSIRVVRPPTTTQHSIGALRQMAARAATGDIIVHWDDDDMYAPDRIEKQVAPIASGLADLTTLRYSYFLALPAGAFHEVEDGGTFMGSLAYRRSLVDEFEFADVSLGEDLHFADRATSACHTHQIVEGVASVYVRHTGDGDGGRLLRNTARPPSRDPAPAPPARHPLTPSSSLPPLQWRWDGRHRSDPHSSGSGLGSGSSLFPGWSTFGAAGKGPAFVTPSLLAAYEAAEEATAASAGRCPVVANHHPEGMLEETHFPAMHPKCCRVPGDVRCSAHRRLGASGSGSGSGNGLSSPPAWSSEGDGCEAGWLKDMYPQGVGTIVGRVCPFEFPNYDVGDPSIIQYSATRRSRIILPTAGRRRRR